MKVDRISLSVRLERLKEGCASDPKYDVSSVKKWACIPICDYMAAFPKEYEKLLELLHLTKQEAETMTYRDIAIEVDNLLSTQSVTRDRDMLIAMKQLALPFECYYSIYIERT